jgi:hypothetical protein
MDPLTTDEIRDSFVNGSKGEAKRTTLPDLATVPWDDLDYLGWPDPSGSHRAYLVTEHRGRTIGLFLRQTAPVGPRRSLCQVCLTPQDVTLTVATKTGAAGKKGDSTGVYICRDLACSLYVRGKKRSGVPRMYETLSVEDQIERLRLNLDEFVGRVLRPTA